MGGFTVGGFTVGGFTVGGFTVGGSQTYKVVTGRKKAKEKNCNVGK